MPRTNPGPSAFLDPAAPTLARVLDRLAVVEPDPRRRGEMTSGVRTLCRVLGRLPHELPADTALLNRLMRAALPMRCAGSSLRSISRRTWRGDTASRSATRAMVSRAGQGTGRVVVDMESSR